MTPAGVRRAALGCLAALAAQAAPPAAPPAETPAPSVLSRVTVRETDLATVVSPSVAQMSYVAAHLDALEVHLRAVARVGVPPGPKPRVEVADVPGLPDIAASVSGGYVLVTVRLGPPADAPLRAGEAAARAWLAAASVASGNPSVQPAPWAPAALAAETVAQLRPAMTDLWYRRAAGSPPPAIDAVVAGRVPPHEALLFGRALRRAVGHERFALALASAARGEPPAGVLAGIDAQPDIWWPAARQALLDDRPSPSLGMAESLAELDALARFVHDPVGQGDVVLTGPQAARLRRLPAVKAAMAERLGRLRLAILRQNPVAHNAWRSLGAWLEAYPSATEEQLDVLWATYLEDRAAAGRLAEEVEHALAGSR
jgi:hypothetical protein